MMFFLIRKQSGEERIPCLVKKTLRYSCPVKLVSDGENYAAEKFLWSTRQIIHRKHDAHAMTKQPNTDCTPTYGTWHCRKKSHKTSKARPYMEPLIRLRGAHPQSNRRLSVKFFSCWAKDSCRFFTCWWNHTLQMFVLFWFPQAAWQFITPVRFPAVKQRFI